MEDRRAVVEVVLVLVMLVVGDVVRVSIGERLRPRSRRPFADYQKDQLLRIQEKYWLLDTCVLVFT